MAEQHFSVASPGTAFYNGKHQLATGITGTLVNGNVVMLDAYGYVTRDDGTGKERGLAYEPMSFVEFPTSNNLVTYMKYKYMNFVGGHFVGFVGKDLFKGSVLPPIGAKLYPLGGADIGLLGITGITGTSAPVGVMDGSATLPVGTTGGSGETVAMVQFDFDIH